MKLHLSKNLLLRTPQFATRSRLQENWEALKLSIKDSSKEFFDQIENIRIEDLDGLPVHFKNTIWKYFNRASYRATPYGSFASVGMMMDLDENNSRAVISSIQQVHDYPDWTSKDQVNFSFEELIKNDAKLFTNSSFYKIGDQWIYQ
ncbi:lantibiotic dehydratase [Mucilaginibacter sp. 22184]|uniref:lantibiotic dehydratase n=1 Tax=Mucilaginibacter sp. 22184 TaxID=3453887 RepID=UPI003F82E875